MMDEAIITASSGVTTFDEPVATIEYSSGPKHVDYFMRDNFSTIPNKIKELANATAASSITADIPRNPQEHMEHITIDQLMGIQTIGKKDITDVLIDIESEDSNVSENNNNSARDAMSKDVLFPETTTSLKVEVSCFKITEENSLISIQPDLSKDGKLCQDLIMTVDEPQKVLTSQRKKSKSSRNRNRKKYKKTDPSIIENNEGFITEHRKTPPIDLTFKPIDTFSDANPFGALQTPTAATPIDQDQCYNLAELYKSPQETPKEGETMNEPEITQLDIATNIPSSFILRRSPVDDNVVPFEELESPKELPRFVHPPNANRVVTATELPESLTLVDGIETLSPNEVKTNTGNKESLTEAKQDLPTDVANAERQKSSFTSVNSKVNKLLDTTQRFLRPEYTIAQPKKESEETPKLDLSPRPSNNTVIQDNKLNSEGEISPVVIDEEPEVLGGFDIIPTSSSESAGPNTDLDHITNVEEIISELNEGDVNVEMQETSFTNKKPQENMELMNSILKQVEANILQDNEKFNEAEKTNDSQTNSDLNINDISSTTILTALDIVRKTYNNIECNTKEETKEMRLELEGNTTTSQSTPEELRNLVQGFEVINKDELVRENYLGVENTADKSEAGLQKGMEKEKIVDSDSAQDATLSSLLGIDYDFPIDESTTSDNKVSADSDKYFNNTLQKLIDKHANAEDDKLGASEHSAPEEEVQAASTENTVFHEEKENNPSIPEDTVSEVIDFLEKPASVENLGSIEKEEFPVHPDVECVQSDMAQTTDETEAHNGSLEEVNRLPIIEMSEVELIAGTIPTTSISSELEDKHLQSLPTTLTTETEEQVYVGFRCISPQAVTVEEQMEEKEVPVDDKLIQLATPSANISSDPPSKEPAGPAATSSAAKSVTAKTTTSVAKPASGAKQTTPSGKTSSVKPTASTTSSAKTSVSGSGSAKPTTTSSATSKPGVIAAKPSAAASSKPVPSSTAPSKPNAQSATTSKSTTSGTVTLKSSTSNVTPSKSAASGVAPPKPTVTSVTSSKASTSTAVSSKTSNIGTTSAKPAVTSGVPSKPATSSTPSSKPTNVSKPATPSSTLPGTNSSKATSSSSTTAKPTVTTTTAKKPVATSIVKPTGTKTTTPSSKPSVVSSTSSTKPVPKPLQISETTLGQKSPSKPSTPTSNPTTPTTPRSPVLKSVPSIVKSPPKPESKSSSVKPSTSSKPVADKKPTTNSEAKPIVKKVEVLKSSTTVATKPSAAPAKPAAATVTKVASSATKPQTPTPAKTTATKPTVAIATKQKQDETSVGVKKSVAATVAKNSEKNSKELVGGKPTNGKTSPTKTSINSKTDTKVTTKNGEKPVPSKKTEEVKKEEKSAQLQEQKVSTTNENTNHTSDKDNISQPVTNMVAEAVN